MRYIRYGLLVLVMSLTMGVLFAQDDLPAEIVVERPTFGPEGIAWDAANGRFLLGSLNEGTVFSVADDGTITPFIESDDFLSTIGIEIDEANGRLLVANSDSSIFFNPSSQGIAGLGAYDLSTGEELFYTELNALNTAEGAQFFANDVAVDADGNAYVTNSFAPEIYKVDMDGNASVFIRDERLSSDFFGLNGIVYHPDGYLLAAVAGQAELYKIPVDAPDEIALVAVDVPFGADGMIFHPDGDLIAVADYFDADAGASVSAVIAVRSDDDWQSATLIDAQDDGGVATTAAIRDGAVYVINAYLNNPAAQQYEIVRYDLDLGE
ncbi:MAG: SMP-30/gluconolactonase/LRE family protein [Aggregatilineales bacterium]